MVLMSHIKALYLPLTSGIIHTWNDERTRATKGKENESKIFGDSILQ